MAAGQHLAQRAAQRKLLTRVPLLSLPARPRSDMENRNKDKCRGWVGFSVRMAHRITAGCDILLMPSRFEPCGLNQLYAMAYGTGEGLGARLLAPPPFLRCLPACVPGCSCEALA